MNRSALVVLVMAMTASIAAAEDWSGVATIPASNSLSFSTNPAQTVCLNMLSTPVGPPPCPPGTFLFAGATGDVQYNLPLPSGVSSPGSGANISVSGAVADPTSPSGYTWLQAQVSLSSFARSDTVGLLQTQLGGINGGLLTLQTQVNGLATTASVSALQEQVNGLATTASVSALQGQMNALATSISSLDARMAALNAVPSAVDQLDQRLSDMKRRSDENSVMASALSPMSPSDGKTNRLGFNGAMIADQSALALNYTHVSGNIDISAGVAVSGDSAMAKAGVGISW